jgi:hypothetical protein
VLPPARNDVLAAAADADVDASTGSPFDFAFFPPFVFPPRSGGASDQLTTLRRMLTFMSRPMPMRIVVTLEPP